MMDEGTVLGLLQILQVPVTFYTIELIFRATQSTEPMLQAKVAILVDVPGHQFNLIFLIRHLVKVEIALRRMDSSIYSPV